MSNRIEAKVAKMEAQIAQRIKDGLTTAEKVEEARQALDMEFDEFAKFQELKSLACVHGLLTNEEGMTIYAYLGTVVSVFNAQPAHVKSVLTQLYAELLAWKIKISR